MTVRIETAGVARMEDVQGFEHALGVLLPAEYRQFLLASNGGRPEPNRFSLRDGKGGSGVTRLYGLTDEDRPGDLRYERNAMRDRLPSQVLPIGDAEGGNAVCLSLAPSTFGSVVFWDHELETDPPSWANLFPLAEDFDVFTKGLQPRAPVSLKPGQVKRSWIDPEFLRAQSGKKKP